MNIPLLHYLKRFKRLRIDRSHGLAPHKPVLLLSVLQLYKTGLITGNRIYITPDLVALFKSYWSFLVQTNHHCRFALPFYHLSGDKFWQLVPKPGFENLLSTKSSISSFSNLNAFIDYAVINEDLAVLMKEIESNMILQQFLLDEYFPLTKQNIENSGYKLQSTFDDIENKILKEDPAEYKAEIKKLLYDENEEDIFLRGAIFKREIPRIYNNTCCISGMRINATIDISMIDACHIIPFAKSYDDTITNGIALCPNLHRAFDRGLIGIDKNYRVIVSDVFIESVSDYSIKKYNGKEIQLPTPKSYWPLKDNFEWHLQNVYRT